MPEFMILREDLTTEGGCGFHGYKIKDHKLLINTIEPTDPPKDYPHLIIFTPLDQPRSEGPYFILNLAGYHYSASETRKYYRLLNRINGTFKTIPAESDESLAPEAGPHCAMLESKLKKVIPPPKPK